MEPGLERLLVGGVPGNGPPAGEHAVQFDVSARDTGRDDSGIDQCGERERIVEGTSGTTEAFCEPRDPRAHRAAEIGGQWSARLVQSVHVLETQEGLHRDIQRYDEQRGVAGEHEVRRFGIVRRIEFLQDVRQVERTGHHDQAMDLAGPLGVEQHRGGDVGERPDGHHRDLSRPLVDVLHQSLCSGRGVGDDLTAHRVDFAPQFLRHRIVTPLVQASAPSARILDQRLRCSSVHGNPRGTRRVEDLERALDAAVDGHVAGDNRDSHQLYLR